MDVDDPLITDELRSWFDAGGMPGALERVLGWATVVTCLVDDGPLEDRPHAVHRLGGPDDALLTYDADDIDVRARGGLSGPFTLHASWIDERPGVRHRFGPAGATAGIAEGRPVMRGLQARALRPVTVLTWPSPVSPEFEAFAIALSGGVDDDSALDAELMSVPRHTAVRVGGAISGIGYDSRHGAPGDAQDWLALLTVQSHDAAGLMIGDAGWFVLHHHITDASRTWMTVASS